MPTGYTWKVEDGTVTDFEAFAWICARGMGALVTMGDDSPDAPVPERFEPSDHDARSAAEHESELARLRALSAAEVEAEAAAAFRAAQELCGELAQRSGLEQARYQAMLDKVLAWVPPTSDHDGFKHFMIQQLRMSMGVDGREYAVNEAQYRPEVWHRERLARAEADLRWHRDQHAQEVERVNARNEWVAQLRRSLAQTKE